MLIKNFKKKVVIIRSLTGHTVRFEPKQECEVPDILVDECIKQGLIPSDDFKQALLDAQAEEAESDIEDEIAAQADEAKVASARADALAKAAADADVEAAAEKAELAAKRSAAAKKGAATKAANESNK